MTEIEKDYIQRLQEENQELIAQNRDFIELTKTQREVIERLQKHSCRHCFIVDFSIENINKKIYEKCKNVIV